MPDSHNAISNLLYEYTHRFDLGDFEGAAELFKNARIKVGDDTWIDHEQLLANWRNMVIIYDDGTPKTKHTCTNPIIEIDEDNNRAATRSYYVVYQQTATLPLQAVAAGRYYDSFERVDNVWRFSERNYSLLDMMGNMKDHLRNWEQIRQRQTGAEIPS